MDHVRLLGEFERNLPVTTRHGKRMADLVMSSKFQHVHGAVTPALRIGGLIRGLQTPEWKLREDVRVVSML